MGKAMKQEQTSSRVDWMVWLLVAVLLVAGIGANLVYGQVPGAVRLAIGVVYACILMAIILTTQKGKIFAGYLKEVRIELRKVVWPTRQETIRTTGFVVAVVVVIALFLWGVDSVVLWAVSNITGQ